MIGIEDIREAARAEVGSGGLFLVEVRSLAGDEFEVFVDSDGGVSGVTGVTGAGGAGGGSGAGGVTVEDCVRLTRAIEARFDRDDPEQDFALTVSSAGIGQPLRVARQYRKLVGRKVEVVLTTGVKMVATLEAANGGNGPEMANGDKAANGGGQNMAGGEQSIESLTLSYPEKQKIEGQKRPQTVTVTKTIPLSEIKSTAEYIDFK